MTGRTVATMLRERLGVEAEVTGERSGRGRYYTVYLPDDSPADPDAGASRRPWTPQPYAPGPVCSEAQTVMAERAACRVNRAVGRLRADGVRPPDVVTIQWASFRELMVDVAWRSPPHTLWLRCHTTRGWHVGAGSAGWYHQPIPFEGLS